MLDLLHAYTGWPTNTSQLSLSRKSFLLYPSGDTVVIVDARSLSLIRILAFWEAFPTASHVRGKVKVVCVDAGLKLVLASMGAQLAFWTLSENESQHALVHCKVHSTLSVQDNVLAADCDSGLLAIGTTTALSVYTLVLQNDIPTWIKKWEAAVPMLSQVLFSPSLTHIASISSEDKHLVRLHLTAVPREMQTIRHPRALLKVVWRAPKPHSRPDLTLYTLTSDSTLRIFHPVLDAPQRLQLHAALDAASFLPSSVESRTSGSHVFPLDRQVLSQTLAKILDATPTCNAADNKSNVVTTPERRRRLEEISKEDWDLFLRIFEDGSLVIRSVAHIDRRPPTLLKQFTLLHTPPSTISLRCLPNELIISPCSQAGQKDPIFRSPLALTTCPPLTSHDLDPSVFFGTRGNGLERVAATDHEGYGVNHNEEPIEKFVRTPDGSGVAVIRASGGEAWTLDSLREKARLRRVGRWQGRGLVAILDRGHTTATYDPSRQQLTLRNHMDSKDITLAVPALAFLFSLPSTKSHTLLFGITTESSIVQMHIPSESSVPDTPILCSNTTLPLPEPPRLILPVDPMAWSTHSLSNEHDVLVSVSNEGELAFWIPGGESNSAVGTPRGKWRCTGTVHTGRTNIRLARCSSAKKTVLVVPSLEGEEVTIWDSKESEFSTGLEYRHLSSISEPIKDLDWTSTSDAQSILAIGYAHHVVLLCQQRMTYFEQEPAWGIFGKVEVSHLTPYPICDSIWLAGGSLLVAAGHQMFHFGQSSTDSRREDGRKSLFETVALQNGPLMDYHPQMLLQCLLWDKLDLVKQVIVRLAKSLEDATNDRTQGFDFRPMDVGQYLKISQDQALPGWSRSQSSTLFSQSGNSLETEDNQGFTRKLVDRLVTLLETSQMPGLTPNERSHLIVLIQTTFEVDEQRRALDSNGLRYLISMRSFYILNQRAVSPTVMNASPKGRQRLRYRDMIWAFHSQSQEILLEASAVACGGKMTWDDAKALGIFLWMESTESLKCQFETIARNEYMAGDVRDPTACSLYFFALGKVSLMHGLWRQAAWHKEQAIMLKFLSNNFQQPRWKTAALKNAYALLGKQRFAYAAAFFLLGGSLRDAVNVCIRQLGDFQLAIALARVVEQGDDGPVFRGLLMTTVIPLAFKEGNRWLGSWAFWKLHRRDLAVRILLTPLNELATTLDITITDVGDPHYDDPSLALLFSQLKLKSLQTAKGTSEIPGRTEFKFALQTARVFCRMGCHVLALDLTTSWSFERLTSRGRLVPSPAAILPSLAEPRKTPSSSAFNKRPFGLHMKRRPSIIIDMDIPSMPPTQPATPTEQEALQNTVIPEEPSEANVRIESAMDDSERQAGLGRLMKSAKQDVSVPEFDVNTFI